MIGYVRVSTLEQAHEGVSLDDQRARIQYHCHVHGWQLDDIYADEGYSAKTLDRPQLRVVLEQLAGGFTDGLIVAKLDRLSRSVVDTSKLLHWFEDAQVRFVALDLNIDTETASGRMVAHMLSAVAEWERDTISERTRAGLAAVRAQGRPISRPSLHDRPELLTRVRAMREEGMTLQAICDVLNTEQVPTLRGGVCWRPSTVQSVLGKRSKRSRPRYESRLDLPEIRSWRKRA